MKLSWLLPALFSIGLVACQKATDDSLKVTEQAEVHRESSDFQCESSDPWSCLKQACEKVGGVYQAKKRQCVCKEDGARFFGWNKPACDSGERHEVNRFDGTIKDRVDGLDVFDFVLPPNFASEFTDRLVLALNHASLPNFRDVKTIRIRPLPATLFEGSMQRMLFASAGMIQKDEFVKPELNGRFPEEIYFEQADDLIDLLESQDTPVDAEVVPANLRNAAAVREFWQVRKAGGAQETVVSASELGCLGLCRVEMSYPVSSNRFVETTLWAGGSPFRHFTLIYQGGDEFPSVAVVQTPRGKPTIYIELETVEPSFARTAVFYSRKGAKLGTTQFAIGDMHSLFDQSLAQAPDVLMCESSIEPKQLQSVGLNRALVKGPYASLSHAPGTSFWGWFKAADTREHFSGLMPISEWGFFDYADSVDPVNFEFAELHASSVLADLLSADESLKVAAMGPKECARGAYKDLAPNLLPRVINYSTGESLSAKVCAETYPALKDPKSLWVFAAGNEGFRERTDAPKNICPQSSVPKALSIIVGALDEEGYVAKYSNQVEGYIDIYAHGVARFASKGTSFAAPKVASVAAKIAKEWPQLTNEQIRMVILLTADIPVRGRWTRTYAPLPAKSGGMMNSEAALRFAEQLSKSPGTSYEAMLGTFYRHDPKLRDFKMNLLRSGKM